MSRGGRSRGIGRGGSLRIGGQEIPWDHDSELTVAREPQALFPTINLSKPRPPNPLEKAQVEHYKAIRKRIHDGPYYTTVEGLGNVRKSEHSDAATFDPFDGMPTFSEKYKPTLRRVPDLSGRTYELHLFPRELWSVLDPKRAKESTVRHRGKRRKLASLATVEAGTRGVNLMPAVRTVDGGDETANDGEEDLEGEDVKIEGQDDEDERSELDPEDDFSEDEDEMADDYNAEKYFETGEGDDDDGGDAGDDGGYD